MNNCSCKCKEHSSIPGDSKLKDLTKVLEKRIFDLCCEKDNLTESNLLRDQWERGKMVEDLKTIDELEEIQKTIESFKSEDSNILQIISSLQSQLLEYSSRAKSLNFGIESRDCLLRQLEEQLDASQKQNSLDAHHLHLLKQENSGLQKQIEFLLNEVSKSNLEKNIVVDSSSKQLTSREREIQEKNQAFQEMSQKVEYLEKIFAETSESNSSLKKQLLESSHSYSSLQSHVNDLSDILSQKENMLVELKKESQTSSSNLKKFLTEKEGVIKELTDELKRVNELLTYSNSKCRDNEETISKQTSTNSSLKSQIEGLQNKLYESIHEFQKRMEQLGDELKSKDNIIQASVFKNELLQSQLSQMNTIIAERDRLCKEVLELEGIQMELKRKDIDRITSQQKIKFRHFQCQTEFQEKRSISSQTIDNQDNCNVSCITEEMLDEKDRIIREFEKQNTSLRMEFEVLKKQVPSLPISRCANTQVNFQCESCSNLRIQIQNMDDETQRMAAQSKADKSTIERRFKAIEESKLSMISQFEQRIQEKDQHQEEERRLYIDKLRELENRGKNLHSSNQQSTTELLSRLKMVEGELSEKELRINGLTKRLSDEELSKADLKTKTLKLEEKLMNLEQEYKNSINRKQTLNKENNVLPRGEENEKQNHLLTIEVDRLQLMLRERGRENLELKAEINILKEENATLRVTSEETRADLRVLSRRLMGNHKEEVHRNTSNSKSHQPQPIQRPISPMKFNPISPILHHNPISTSYPLAPLDNRVSTPVKRFNASAERIGFGQQKISTGQATRSSANGKRAFPVNFISNQITFD